MTIKSKLKTLFFSLFLTAPFINCSNILEEPLKKNLEQRLTVKPKKNNKKDKYALLLSGFKAKRDLLDILEMKNLLLENGYNKKNIYILDAHDPYQFNYSNLGKPNNKNISKVLDYLSMKVDKEDTLFVYFTGHGNWVYDLNFENERVETIKVSSFFTEEGSYFTSQRLEEYLNKIEPKKTIIFADLCHAGEFTERFFKKGYVSIASSSLEGLAYANVDDSFSRSFIAAFRNKNLADTDKNGAVSIKEAFDYAKKYHKFVKKTEPQIKSKKDPNKIYLK